MGNVPSKPINSSNFHPTNQRNSFAILRHNGKHSLRTRSKQDADVPTTTHGLEQWACKIELKFLKCTKRINILGRDRMEMKIKRTQEAPLSKHRSSEAVRGSIFVLSFNSSRLSRFCVAFEKKIFSCLRIIFWLNDDNPPSPFISFEGTCAGVLWRLDEHRDFMAQLNFRLRVKALLRIFITWPHFLTIPKTSQKF